jgi:hypothetical protein
MKYPTNETERVAWFEWLNKDGPDSFATSLNKKRSKKEYFVSEDRFPDIDTSVVFPGYRPDQLPPMGEPILESYYKHFTFNFDSFEVITLLTAEQPMVGASPSTKINFNQDEEIEQIMKTKEQYAIESANRTKKKVSRLLTHNYTKWTRLVTLTYALPCYDWDEHWRNLNLATQRFREEYGESLAYMAVPELHPGGHGWHFHLVVNSTWFDYMVFQEKIWALGIVKVSRRPSGTTSEMAQNLASYLVKYVSKEIARGSANKRRYSIGGTWATDWITRSGVADDRRVVTRRVIAYLASMSIPYRLFTIRPYDGQEIDSITYPSGLFPDIPMDRLLNPAEYTRTYAPPPEKSLTSQTRQLVLDYDL